jgi:glycosyltransferase involved in cell wall biosynthesis
VSLVGSISVVLCTYNRADRVTASIATVLGQTLDDFELVVVDDGSVENTREVVATIDDTRLRYIHRENGGLSAARTPVLRSQRAATSRSSTTTTKSCRAG